MFKITKTDYQTSGVLGQLVSDYLDRKPELRKFYNEYPDIAGFKNILDSNPYTSLNRAELSKILSKQALLAKNTSAETRHNIALLGDPTTFTVTTGHQLCIFTGPLYFIIKIFSTINLAEELKTKFPAHNFVPVYWMASEDHDFEEINHLHLFGKKISWESSQTGAVGDMQTSGLSEMKETLKELFGNSAHAADLLSLFSEAYLNHGRLADATRYLVNALFGKYGLVIVDGNDASFKIQFKEIFKKDVFDQIPFQTVEKSIGELKTLGYHAQVNPREINCFLLAPQTRSRIEKKGDHFSVAGTDHPMNRDELRSLIEDKPEKISPNVTLRPVYQQYILPNIAYTGGPGELAYWLEYKHMFETLAVFFPVLVPRNFFTLIDKNQSQRLHKLGFETKDIFQEEESLIREFQVARNNVFEAEEEKEKLKTVYDSLAAKIQEIDKTLSPSVAAELQKSINGLDAIAGKVNRALKQKSETELNQIRGLKQKLFPGGGPLERSENFSSFYLKYGPGFLDALKNSSGPLEFSQVILEEN